MFLVGERTRVVVVVFIIGFVIFEWRLLRGGDGDGRDRFKRVGCNGAFEELLISVNLGIPRD